MGKTKITLSILLIVVIILHAHSQNNVSFPGDVTLSTQAEVDAFNYTDVTGTLTISGNDISNLDALSALTQVGSGLIISDNTSLSNVNGLSALETVNNGINISANQVLTNLNGLFSLTEVHGPITISDNPLLETINGFSSITLIDGLWISNNNQLKSINGFNGVTWISGTGIAYLIIDNNPSLTNVDGLSSLRGLSSLTSSLIITNNASLSNIDGLSSLNTFSYIGSTIDISNNPALKNINGLASLSQFGDFGALSWLTIQNNAVLEDIDGLSNLRGPFGVLFNSRITITNNPLLMRCSGLYPLLVSMGWDVVNVHVADGSFQVKENGAGCTIEDIIYGGPQTIEAFSVINKKTGAEVSPVYQFAVTLDLADPEFSNWAIKALTFPAPVGSVGFRFDNKIKHTDNAFPYTFSLPKHLTVGTHTVKADVYSKARRKGQKGIGQTVTITVINSAVDKNKGDASRTIATVSEEERLERDSESDLTLYPVPVEHELFVKMDDTVGKDAVLSIRTIHGQSVYEGTYSKSSSINTSDLKPGMYILQVVGNNGFKRVVKFIKK